jgi:hypothetical protein
MPRTPISAPSTPRAFPLLWGGTGGRMVLLGIVTTPYIRTDRIRRITAGFDEPVPDAPPVSGASAE